jgi:hypothetical protein
MAAGCAPGPPAAKPALPEPTRGSSATTRDEGAGKYVEICVRKSTLVRTEYRPCDDEEKGYAWYFVPMTANVPAIGKKPGTGMSVEPSGVYYRAPEQGGKGIQVMIFLNQDVVEICVKKRTRVRMPDAHCEREEKGYVWYYLLRSRQIPAVGTKAMKGSFRSSEYFRTFRARPAGGKGDRVAFEPRDESVDSEEPKTTRTPAPTKKPADTDAEEPEPTRTRTSTRLPAKRCTTTRTGKTTTTRCS